MCDNFLQRGKKAGLTFEEIFTDSEDARWMGEMEVDGLGSDALTVRKSACRYWIGSWAS